MTVVWFGGAETGDTSELLLVGNATTIDSTQHNGDKGAYSYKNPGNGTDNVVGFASSARVRCKASYRFGSFATPGSANAITLFKLFNGTASFPAAAYLIQNTDATIQLIIQDNNGATIGTAAISPVASTWYRFEFDVEWATGNATIYMDGLAQISVTGQDFGATNFLQLDFGNGLNASYPFWIDDIIIDDAQLPGPQYVIARQCAIGTPTYDNWTKV